MLLLLIIAFSQLKNEREISLCSACCCAVDIAVNKNSPQPARASLVGSDGQEMAKDMKRMCSGGECHGEG